MDPARQTITQIYDQTPKVIYRLRAFEKFENFSFVFQVRIHFNDIHTVREPRHLILKSTINTESISVAN